MGNRGEPRKPSQFVYFVRAEKLGLIKIGCARRMKDRMWALQCGSPDKLTLLGVIRDEDAAGFEKSLHGIFRAHHSHGEWYHPAPDLLAFISESAWDVEAEHDAYLRQLAEDMARRSQTAP